MANKENLSSIHCSLISVPLAAQPLPQQLSSDVQQSINQVTADPTNIYEAIFDPQTKCMTSHHYKLLFITDH